VEFQSAEHHRKQNHFNALDTLYSLCHALPRAGKSEDLILFIQRVRFHRICHFDGWNDKAIETARKAIMDYLEVCLRLDIDSFINLTTLFPLSAMQTGP